MSSDGGRSELVAKKRRFRKNLAANAKKNLPKPTALGSFCGRVNIPALIVFACCLLFALQMGVLEPDFYFQKTGAQINTVENCSYESRASTAFAAGGWLLLPILPSQKSSSFASFDGVGNVDALRLRVEDPDVEVTQLSINGQTICAPCNQSEYSAKIGRAQRLEVLVEAGRAQAAKPEKGAGLFSQYSIFDTKKASYIEAPLSVFVDGGWKATENTAMPSTFYRIDSPFYLQKTREVADSIRKMGLPQWGYGVVSALPPALLQVLTGVSHQYAYKLWLIALFFVPIVIFHAFSRKLSRGADAVFLFSSLIYLFLPSFGYPTGGGADLFFYGLTAHTLATYLSLGFFYFAYEFCMGGGRGKLAAAMLLFLLAFAVNPRIALALGIMLLVLLPYAAVRFGIKRAALLAAGCLASAVWLAAPFFLSFAYGSYPVLGGVELKTQEHVAFSFLQLGMVVLPLFFAIGMWIAYRRREAFALLLSLAAVAAYIFATNPEINRAFPFIDGVRFFPSILLPAFFVAAIGAHWLWEWLRGSAEILRRRVGMDEITFSGCVLFAVLLPLAALFVTVMISTVDQFSAEGRSLFAASEYTWLERAYALSGGGRAVVVGGWLTSQYPIFDQWLSGTTLVGGKTPTELAALMQEQTFRYAIVGNVGYSSGNESGSAWQDYQLFLQDGRFAEVVSYGSGRMLLLKGEGLAEPAAIPQANTAPQGYETALAAACALVALSCIIISKK